LLVPWLAAGCAVYDLDSLDQCTRTSCDDSAADAPNAATSATSATSSTSSTGPHGSVTGSGGPGVTVGGGGSGLDAGAGGAGGANGTGSGGASGTNEDAGIEARDAPPEATATMEAGPTTRCPSAISLANSISTAQHGMPANGPTSTDVCPDGQALVGYGLSATTPSNFPTAIMSKIEPACGAISIASDSTGCNVVISSGANLPARGRYSSGAVMQRCPSNQIIVAFAGRAGRDTDQLSFGCAPLAITKVDESYRVSVGSVTFLGAVGGNGGSAFQDGCPSGAVATGNKITDENGFIGAFGLVCASIAAVP
jgi:hypothetical protein